MTLEQAKALYDAKEVSLENLADQFGYSVYKMRRLLVSIGTNIRTTAESRSGKTYTRNGEQHEYHAGQNSPGGQRKSLRWCREMAGKYISASIMPLVVGV